jgi:hypothetical protein
MPAKAERVPTIKNPMGGTSLLLSGSARTSDLVELASASLSSSAACAEADGDGEAEALEGVADGVEADGVEADGVEADGVEADGVEADGVEADGVNERDSVSVKLYESPKPVLGPLETPKPDEQVKIPRLAL